MNADPTRLKIALFGNFGTGNLGNEATLQAMVDNLRRFLPNVEILCVCPEPQIAASDYNISGLPIRASFPIWRQSSASAPPKTDREPRASKGSPFEAVQPGRQLNLRALARTCAYPLLETYRWVKGIASLKDCDLLIMTGTGMLGDYAIRPLGLHYDIFRWAVIAKICGCKLLFVSVGGGSIRYPLSRWLVRIALALADYRSYRDAPSKDHLGAIGVNVTNDPVYPDLAFSLSAVGVTVGHHFESKGGVIGVGVMNYNGSLGPARNDDKIYREYLGRIASFVVRLLERGHTVRVLIGDVTWDQGARRDLRRALEERGIRYEDGRIIDEPASSIDELLSQLSSVDLVVSSRFHNLLLGLMLGKPVFAISYHQKFQPLMNAVGLGEFSQDIEHIDVDDLARKVDVLLTDAPGVKLQIARETKGYCIALDEQYQRILDVAASLAPRLGPLATVEPDSSRSQKAY
jgi:polysaccharide pyruvyl transferase WcaK-like protein